MGYLKKIDGRSKDKKKVAGARVSEVVLAALSSAENDIDNIGYSFSVSKIIETALDNTLLELKDKTGIDYYKLIKWQRRLQKSFNIITQYIKTIDFDQYVIELKETVINSTIETQPQYDFDDELKYRAHSLAIEWNFALEFSNSPIRIREDGGMTVFGTELVAFDDSYSSSLIYLAKLLDKTDEEFVQLLEIAGIIEKNINSSITQEEKRLLIQSTSKWSKKSWQDITPEENKFFIEHDVKWGMGY
ncbi:MAG TPA: hypothetical protein EYQ45_04140 [Flavobacteriaceae bacterium]|jgi:hypothetical protein|nr:hypothetical protein [Flavobacteriaceae bacterium]